MTAWSQLAFDHGPAVGSGELKGVRCGKAGESAARDHVVAVRHSTSYRQTARTTRPRFAGRSSRRLWPSRGSVSTASGVLASRSEGTSSLGECCRHSIRVARALTHVNGRVFEERFDEDRLRGLFGELEAQTEFVRRPRQLICIATGRSAP